MASIAAHGSQGATATHALVAHRALAFRPVTEMPVGANPRCIGRPACTIALLRRLVALTFVVDGRRGCIGDAFVGVTDAIAATDPTEFSGALHGYFHAGTAHIGAPAVVVDGEVAEGALRAGHTPARSADGWGACIDDRCARVRDDRAPIFGRCSASINAACIRWGRDPCIRSRRRATIGAWARVRGDPSIAGSGNVIGPITGHQTDGKQGKIVVTHDGSLVLRRTDLSGPLKPSPLYPRRISGGRRGAEGLGLPVVLGSKEPRVP